MARLLLEGLRNLVSPDVLRSGMPTSEDLDRQMGRPIAAWLDPLRALVGDPDPVRPGPGRDVGARPRPGPP